MFSQRKTGVLRPAITSAAAAAALLCVLAGCGADDTSDQGGAEPAAPAATGPGGARGGAAPGASGEIADLTGTTLQVQNADSGQVAVTYTDTTEFTQQVTVTAADLAVGDCVMVASDDEAGTDPVAATRVAITAPVDWSCQPGDAGGGGGGGGTRPARPSGAPPSGAAGARPAGAFGAVTEVTATGFTVESIAQADDAETQVSSVSVSADTTWTSTEAATATALQIGRCVTATGEADDTGAVTATRISITDPVDGECAAGAGRRQGGGA